MERGRGWRVRRQMVEPRRLAARVGGGMEAERWGGGMVRGQQSTEGWASGRQSTGGGVVIGGGEVGGHPDRGGDRKEAGTEAEGRWGWQMEGAEGGGSVGVEGGGAGSVAVGGGGGGCYDSVMGKNGTNCFFFLFFCFPYFLSLFLFFFSFFSFRNESGLLTGIKGSRSYPLVNLKSRQFSKAVPRFAPTVVVVGHSEELIR